jgi:MFS family permease
MQLQGSLADRFGKKWFIVAGGLVGIAGNIVAGTASNIETVIGGQAMNGIASSLLVGPSRLISLNGCLAHNNYSC